MDDKLHMLRHTVATLAYRGGKAIRGAPADFSSFQSGPGGRTAGEILAHLGDLFDWSLGLCEGRSEWHVAPVRTWTEDSARFHTALEALDCRLSSGVAVVAPEKVFQGPIADALTHVGQLAMLRRMAGAPIRGENYHKANIEAGRVGADQAPPVFEF